MKWEINWICEITNGISILIQFFVVAWPYYGTMQFTKEFCNRIDFFKSYRHLTFPRIILIPMLQCI